MSSLGFGSLQLTRSRFESVKKFEIELKKFFPCGDFDAAHQDLNCKRNIENGEKTLEAIETAHFELLNSDFHKYQLH